MRVVVVGATGNVGTSVVSALLDEPAVTDLVGVARRQPQWRPEGVTWQQADVASDDLRPVVAGADAVIHLAWLLQPSHNQPEQWETNVVGTRRLLDAVAAETVASFIYASSIGAYSPAPAGQLVDETWPTDGVPTSPYSRQKAYTERVLDAFEAANPTVRVARLRPGLIVKPGAASEIRRLFGGPFLPTPLLRAVGLPVWPATKGLELQFVHSHDAAEAYRLALLSDESGAFNIAADPIIDAATAAEALQAWKVPVPGPVLRGLAAATWHLRLQPADPGWIDLAIAAPLLDTTRARTVLGWTPQHAADQALAEFIEAVGRSEGMPTPPLDPASSGVARSSEIATGVGGRSI
jgi:nucleoside-diphosphate-sugar epimerase